MTDLDKLLDSAHQQARRILLGKADEQLVAMWVLANRDDQLMVIATPFEGPFQKDLVAIYMRQFMVDHDIVAYSFLTEAWVVVLEDKDHAEAKGVIPSQDPRRVEVVLACACTADDSKLKMWKMRRDKSGRVTALVEDKHVSGSGIHTFFGRFGDLLQRAQ